jgi:hypothetical protein
MRRSLRFFKKVVARDAAQNHPFQPVQIVEAIAGGFAHRGQERLARIFLEQTQQLPQGKRHHFAALFLQRRHIPGDLRRGV